jgi:large subunit ribosomal protein L21e
MVLGYRSKTR